MAKTKAKLLKEMGPGVTAYTIDFPIPVWRNVKALAAVRGLSIRQFIRDVVQEELAKAKKDKELTVGGQ